MVDELKNLGVNVEEKTLPVGDWLFPSQDNLLIERSTVLDLVKKVRTRRLWEQLTAMLNTEGARPALLLEGPLTLIEKFTSWNPRSVAGILLSIIFEYNIPIVPSPNKQWSFNFLYTMAKDRERSRAFPMRFVTKDKELWMIQRGLVEGLPGVSAKRAENLLRYFKKPINIFTASEEQLQEVEDVGEVISKRIREVLDTEYQPSQEVVNAR